MADNNKTMDKIDPPKKLYSEILSPSELFAARARSHKIPVRGQKDFFPDDSDEQRERLEHSLKEHWSLLSEERVERQGNLVKATWIPSEQIVELQSPAGKFWQTMGFSENSKQYLQPEEALYLMECGNLQVFYQDLPLSIQDGYERFLSSKTVSLQQYQVFGHMKRLGYVMHRFDPSSEPSSYARQLNLPPLRDRAGRQLKRKHSASQEIKYHIDAQNIPATERMDDKCSHEEEVDEKLSEMEMMISLSLEAETVATSSTEKHRGRTWWMTGVRRDSVNQADCHAPSRSPHWDFGSIVFPDLGSTEYLSSCLVSPDSSLLPGALAVGDCDLAPWRRKINMREVKMSSMERKRDNRRDHNREREVRRCRNWAEYQDLLARWEGKCKDRPAHLWNREVSPLHDMRQPIPTGELLDKISVIKSTHLLEGASRLKCSDEWRICFNVYQPDTVADFKKSNPGKPYSRMCVCSFNDPVPDLQAIKLLAFQSGDVPVVFAVVDHGDISMFTFKDFQLPTDVYP